MVARALSESGLLQDVGRIIVCEPTQESIGLFEKGALWVRVSACGVSCHASRPELGANAIEALFTFAAKARGALDFSQNHAFLGKKYNERNEISWWSYDQHRSAKRIHRA